MNDFLKKIAYNLNNEQKRRVILVNLFNLTAVVSLLFFGINGIFEQNYSYSIVLFSFLFVTLTNLFLLNFKNTVSFSSHVTVTLMFILELILFVFLTSEGYSVLWFYVFPPLSTLLIGYKKGFWTSFVLLIISLITYLFFADLISFEYKNSFIIRFLFTYSIILIMVVVYEYSRKVLQIGFDKKLEELQSKNEELIVAEEGLRTNNKDLKELNSKIKENERKFSTIFTNLGEGIIITDFQENFVYANNAADEIFGLKHGQLIGRNLKEFISDDELRMVFSETLKRKENISSSYQLDVKIDDELSKTLLITGVPYYDGNEEKPNRTLAVFRDVTEYKKAENIIKEQNEELLTSEEELRQSNEELKVLKEKIFEREERLRKIIENQGEGFGIINANGEFIFANPAAEEIFEVGRDMLIGLSLADFFSPIDIAKINELAQNCEIGDKITYDLQLFTKKQNKKWIQVTVTLDCDEENNIIGQNGIFRDITKLKSEQDKIIELNAQLNKYFVALEQSPVSFVITDTNAKIQYVNPFFSEMTGYSYEEVIGRNPKILKTKYTHPDVFKDLWQTITAGKSWDGELVNHRKDGSIFTERAVIAPIKDKNGQITNYVAIKEDISDLKSSQKKVSEKNAQQRILIENIPANIFYKNADLQFVMLNDSYAKMLGVKKKDIIGKRFSEVFEGHDSADFEAVDKKVLTDGNPVMGIENRHINPDGSESWVSVSKVPYFDEQGNAIGLVGIIHDITERKNKEVKLKQLNTELSKYYAAIDQSSIGIVFVDKNGIRQYVNNKYLQITGYTSEQALNHKSSLFEEGYEELLDKVRTGKIITREIYRKAEKEFYERFVVSAIFDDNNEVLWYVILIEDITKNKEQQKIIEEQHNRLLETHKQITESINYAKFIQKSILPDIKSFSEYFSDSFVMFRPKEIISGDFYYIKEINKKLIVAVADCTGHGVPGAFISMLSYTMLNEVVSYESVNSPGQALNVLRNEIKNIFQGFSGGMDIALCVIDTQTNVLEYAGAYNPVFILSENELIEFKATLNPIGSYPVERNFETQSIELKDNDILYLFSDGYYDQFGIDENDKNTKFSKKRFRKLITSVSKMELSQQKKTIENSFDFWRDGAEQIDDVTVIGLKWKIKN